MKLPLSWVREWIEFDATAEQIADALTRRGLYVEGVETHGGSFPGVVVARVLDVARHPNADRLSLCRVDSGSGELSVVCGAPNVRAGMIVPLATVGAVLPGGLVIRKSKIRGEESQGMLCSARELELSDDHEGIVDLERYLAGHRTDGASLGLGVPLADVLGPPESVLEVEIPFNRGDCLSILGLAREVRAAFGGRWTGVARKRLEAQWNYGKNAFPVALEDPEGCPLYLAQEVRGITIGPSPSWIAKRLESVGQRAINNVVDITNLVLFEFGQPLHAFDLDRLQGPEIRVRRARAGETLVTLDGKTRTLDPEVLLIADRDRPVALAGIMGGAESEVTAATTSLLLECAWFEPRRVRRGSHALGLSTEASKRFERNVDFAVCEQALMRFLELLSEVCPQSRPGAARQASEAPIVHRMLHEAEKHPITLRVSRVERLVGARIELDEMARLLESLEFGVKRRGKDALEVVTRRADVTIEEDLVEEIARSWGYDRIPEAPLETHGAYAQRDERERLVEQARAAMIARGLTEAWTSSLVSEGEARSTGALTGDKAPTSLRLVNPMSREGEVLRPNPVAGLLRACAHNMRQGTAAVRLFEVGAGFAPRVDGLPAEPLMLAAIVSGPRFEHGHDAVQQPLDFEDAKGLWEAWLEEMRVDTPEWRAYSAPGWKPGASAEVASGTSRIGWAGTLGVQLLREWDIEVPVHLLLVHLDAVSRSRTARPSVHLPGRFPPVRRDLAFFVPDRVTHQALASVLRAAAGDWLVSLELFDVYAGAGTPPGMKGLAFALQFQHPERTLAEAEILKIQNRMTEAAAKECGAKLRER